MSAAKKTGKMADLINWRLRITMIDGRQLTGTLLAFDKFMNVVLADTEEFRRIKRKANKSAPPTANPIMADEKRTLGLIILRGGNIVSLSVESPPPADPSARLGAPTGMPPGAGLGGPGIARPAGRGLPTMGMGAPPGMPGMSAAPIAGLAGPMRGAGLGPAPGMPGGIPPPAGFAMGGPPPGFAPGGAPPAGFQGPPGYQGGLPGQGRGFPGAPGFGGR
ncbi:Sm-like ribonucleo protein [Ascobolus immersus RN42]|uniref:Sm protein B n=1 Tax=Ascobolus immersus RN42 TaxID=1160509 RepID=A0A3N4IMI8_ASCIM|nr:Sm-like ribonucleo protein [Ascobolus immersus RN42]